MSDVTPQSWAAALLSKLGAPVSKNNMISVLAWEEAEGGHFHNGAHWNPLNTTLDGAKYGTLPGNTAGVAVYPDYRTGLDETAATLHEPRYAAVLHNLKASAAPSTTTASVAGSRWGTWHGASPTPNVETAAGQVNQHPEWLAGTHHTATHRAPAHHAPGHHAPGHHGSGHHGPPDPGAPSSGHDTIVLDLPELARLDQDFLQFSQDVQSVRRQLQSLQVQLATPMARISVDWIKSGLTYEFEFLTEPQWSLDSNARQLSDISGYCGSIRSLAEKADADDHGASGPGAASRFKHDVARPAHAPQGWEAVFAALHGGRILRHGRSKKQHSGSGTDTTIISGTGTTTIGGPSHHHPGSGTGTTTIGGPTRAEQATKIINIAHSQNGVHEVGGYNDQKYGQWYGANGAEWCAIYVSWVYAHAGHPLPAINGSHGFYSVKDGIDYATAHHQLDSKPQVGDIFLYKNGGHTGIVTAVHQDGSFDTSEGNSGPDTDEVYQTHRVNDGSYDFWNPLGATS